MDCRLETFRVSSESAGGVMRKWRGFRRDFLAEVLGAAEGVESQLSIKSEWRQVRLKRPFIYISNSHQKSSQKTQSLFLVFTETRMGAEADTSASGAQLRRCVYRVEPEVTTLRCILPGRGMHRLWVR
jgi:hypothetical protein